MLGASLNRRGTQGESLVLGLLPQGSARTSFLSVSAAYGKVIDDKLFFAAKCPYRTLKIRMKSAIECHIHAVFAGLVKLDDVCGLGWQQWMFVVLGQARRCLVLGETQNRRLKRSDWSKHRCLVLG